MVNAHASVNERAIIMESFASHIVYFGLSFDCNWSSNGICPLRIFRRASAIENQKARIYLWEIFHHTRSLWPFHAECVALHLGRVAIPFRGPSKHGFSTWLFHWSEFEKVSLRDQASLLLKFAQCGMSGASSSNSPLGMDQAASSLCSQNGPPMCARSTSTEEPLRLNKSKPALFFAFLLGGKPWCVISCATTTVILCWAELVGNLPSELVVHVPLDVLKGMNANEVYRDHKYRRRGDELGKVYGG